MRAGITQQLCGHALAALLRLLQGGVAVAVRQVQVGTGIDQLGDDLLIAPLLEENATSREVYLPDGVWFDFFDGTKYSGNQTVTAGKDGKLPVFTRNGFELEK